MAIVYSLVRFRGLKNSEGKYCALVLEIKAHDPEDDNPHTGTVYDSGSVEITPVETLTQAIVDGAVDTLKALDVGGYTVAQNMADTITARQAAPPVQYEDLEYSALPES